MQTAYHVMAAAALWDIQKYGTASTEKTALNAAIAIENSSKNPDFFAIILPYHLFFQRILEYNDLR